MRFVNTHGVLAESASPRQIRSMINRYRGARAASATGHRATRRLRLLVVSELRLATFELEAARRAVEWHPPELPNGGKEDIRRALHGLARNQPVSYRPPRALDLLRVGTGIPDATFRAGQEEAVRHVVEGRGRLLVVERTGWGKSFVYFIATKLLREAGRGPALLV